MTESITVTIPDAIALNVTSPSPAGVSVLSPSASSIYRYTKGQLGGYIANNTDPISLIATPKTSMYLVFLYLLHLTVILFPLRRKVLRVMLA